MTDRRSSALGLLGAVLVLASAPRTAHARGCSDRTRVVGYTRCSRYGTGIDASTRPSLSLTLSPTLGTLDLGDLTLTGSTDTQGHHFAFSFPASEAGVNTAWVMGVQADVRWFLRRWWYVGTSVGLGMASLPGSWQTSQAAQLNLGDLYVLRGGVVTGFGIPVGPVMFRAEVMVGGRTTWMMPSTVVGESVSEVDLGRWDWVVAPRAAIEVFVQPTISVSAMVASELVPSPNLLMAVGLGFHFRSFDGTYDP